MQQCLLTKVIVKTTFINKAMISLLEWITENGYVKYKDEKWYKSSQYPRVFLKKEELIELYESTSNKNRKEM